MSLELSVTKTEETRAYCVYTFGPPGGPTGRARLHKDAGDVELTVLPDRDDGSSVSFYLAHLVPRLQAYHDAGTYPDRDHWAL
jgi:hypothetical protein